MSVYAVPAGLLVLLVAEVFGLTIAFDTQVLDGVPRLWAQVVGSAPQMFRLGSCAAIAAGALVALNRRDPLRDFVTRVCEPRRRRGYTAIHLGALAFFAYASSMILAAPFVDRSDAIVWAAAWYAAGLTVLVTWCLLLASSDAWRNLVRSASGSVTAGVLLGTTAWSLGFITKELWIPMAQVTFTVVTWVLGFFYPRTVSNPAKLLVGTPAFRVVISPQCSGYEGVGLVLVFLAAYLWIFRKELRLPLALVLLPLGAMVAWTANVARIVALIAIGSAGWQQVAAGGFHSQAGWIAFNAIALGFVALINQGQWFRAAAPDRESDAAGSAQGEPTTAYLGPFLMVSATAMLTGALSSGFDWLYPLRVVAVAAALWMFRRHYAGLRWSFSWWSVAIGSATFAIWLGVMPRSQRPDTWTTALQSIPLGWAIAWLVVRSIGYVVLAPIAEELAFRGYLARRVTRVDFQNLPLGAFSWASFVASSVAFGVLHGSLWLPGTIAGMSFALALYRRGAFGEAVWAHATTNGLIAMYACATGQWWVWS